MTALPEGTDLANRCQRCGRSHKTGGSEAPPRCDRSQGPLSDCDVTKSRQDPCYHSAAYHRRPCGPPLRRRRNRNVTPSHEDRFAVTSSASSPPNDSGSLGSSLESCRDDPSARHAASCYEAVRKRSRTIVDHITPAQKAAVSPTVNRANSPKTTSNADDDSTRPRKAN